MEGTNTPQELAQAVADRLAGADLISADRGTVGAGSDPAGRRRSLNAQSGRRYPAEPMPEPVWLRR